MWGFALCRDACCVPCSVTVEDDSGNVCQLFLNFEGLARRACLGGWLTGLSCRCQLCGFMVSLLELLSFMYESSWSRLPTLLAIFRLTVNR